MSNKIVDTATEYFALLKTASTAHNGPNYPEEIRRLLRDGKVTWNELPFTEADLECEERAADVRQAEQHFVWLKGSEGDYYGSLIRQSLERREIGWEELSFTEAELLEEAHKAQIRMVERSFMRFKRGDIGHSSWHVRHCITRARVDWSDLSFTEEDLRREEQRRSEGRK